MDGAVLIIIPAYNEQDSLAHVIDEVRANVPSADILVVDDGSVDNTAAIARSKGVILLGLPYNLGIGGAVQTGYKFAAEMGYDVVVQVDGDGQHPAEQIPRLINELQRQGIDMVIGARFKVTEFDYSMPFARRVGARVLCTTIRLLYGQQVVDPTSGFRAVNRNVIRLLARMYPRDYPEPEAIALLHKSGYAMAEVPVQMNQRLGGVSSISFFDGLFYVAKVVLALLMDTVKTPIGPSALPRDACSYPDTREEE